MELKEFAQKTEKIMFDYSDAEILQNIRSPFDYVVYPSRTVWEWVRLKVECKATDVTKEQYNEWIIKDFENGFLKKRTREKAIKMAKPYLID